MEFDDRYLRAKECAEYFGVGKSTWWRWVNEGKVSSGLLLGPRIRVWKYSTIKKAAKMLATPYMKDSRADSLNVPE